MFPLMAIVAYHIMMLNENPAHAMDIAYSILVASMLIDEGHKAMIILANRLDKKVAASEAQRSINKFLGRDSKVEDEPIEDGVLAEKSLSETLSPSTRGYIDGSEDFTLENVMLYYPGRDDTLLLTIMQARKDTCSRWRVWFRQKYSVQCDCRFI